MKIINLLLITKLLLLSYQIGYAQKETFNKRSEYIKSNNIWTFGEKTGLDFTNGRPVLTQSEIPYEGAASVCDPETGKLIFYTDGVKCWNANHQVMPNGDSLLGGQNIQDVCIVPFINDPEKYYIFKVLGYLASSSAPTGRFHYSVVDMSLDEGRGDVVVSEKNVPLAQDESDTFSTGIIAIPGENCDIWLMTHTFGKSAFKAYHITENGINQTPVVSEAGHLNISNIFVQFGIFSYLSGSYYRAVMSVSPNRKFIAISSFDVIAAALGFGDPLMNGLLICRFNPETGIVSDAIEVEDDLIVAGSAFSPDNSKLYFHSLDILKGTSSINQYDITNYDSTAIAASKTVVGDTIIALCSELNLYKDTIYLRHMGTGISTINQPNLSGTLCDFDKLIFSVVDNIGLVSLHNNVVYAYPKDSTFRVVMDTVICKGVENGLNLHAFETLEGYTYTWNTGEQDTSLQIFDGGIYTVEYNNGCYYKMDSFKIVNGTVAEPIITVDIMELGTTIPYSTYQWLLNGNIIAGATNSTYIVTENGDYQVIVGNEEGCMDTSDIYEVRNVGINDTEFLARQIKVYPNPSNDMIFIDSPIPVDITILSMDGRAIIQKENTSQLSIKELASGVYMLRISGIHDETVKIEKLIKSN